MEETIKKTGAVLPTTLLLCLAALSVLLGGVSFMTKAEVQTWQPAVEAGAWSAAPTEVVPLGRSVGIKLFSDGVLVVGLSGIETDGGEKNPGRDGGLKSGDLITHINGEQVDTIEQVQQQVLAAQADPMALTVARGDKTIQLSVMPALNRQGNYQLGAWLRDSMAGIGTLTFYDPQSGSFGALGHGVNDVDTAMLMPLDSGSIMYASVVDVKKGEKGNPGELHGNFDVTQDLGQIYANTDMGIYGTLTDEGLQSAAQAVPIATRDDIQVGAATILSNIRGEEVEEFTVNIVQIYPEITGEKRNLMLEVTDQRLLDNTGGIVQGMSGSPILQNGKLVGAVTHVLVSDPTRGYGILAQNMMTQTQQQQKAS